MLLVFDVGNTNTVLGAYENKTLIASFRISTEQSQTSDEYGVMIYQLFAFENIPLHAIEDVIISSVVPEVMHSIENFCIKYLHKEPMIVGPGVKTGMNIRYENPQQVGADRIVNAVAGYEKYKQAMIIIDFGTATTFCAISSKGEYLGGAISPGIKISTEALFQRASKLHKVEIMRPKSIIGKNTTAALQAGIIFGYAGLVDNLVSLMRKEMREADALVLATGGLAPIICAETRYVDHIEKYLTLEGLRIIYERNKI